MQYRTIRDDQTRWIDADDPLIQRVEVDPDHDTIFGLRGVVEFAALQPNDLPFPLELWTFQDGVSGPYPFFKFYEPAALNPGVYTIDWRTSVPAFPQESRGDYDQQTDTVELRVDWPIDPTQVIRSEVQVLEF